MRAWCFPKAEYEPFRLCMAPILCCFFSLFLLNPETQKIETKCAAPLVAIGLTAAGLTVFVVVEGLTVFVNCLNHSKD